MKQKIKEFLLTIKYGDKATSEKYYKKLKNVFPTKQFGVTQALLMKTS